MVNLLLTVCLLLAFIAHTKQHRACQILIAIALLLFVVLSLGMMELEGFEEFCDEIVDLSEVYEKLEGNKLLPVEIEFENKAEKEQK
jgi:hypothetical protein